MALRPSTFNYLLRRHGKDCTLKVVTEGTYNPSTGSSVPSEVDYTVRCHPANYKLEDGSLPDVSLGSRRIMVSGTDTSGNDIPKPKSGDTISGFGDEAMVTQVDEVYSLGVIYYMCMVRE